MTVRCQCFALIWYILWVMPSLMPKRIKVFFYALFLIALLIWKRNLYSAMPWQIWRDWLDLGFIIVGVVAGWVLPILDHVIYCYTYPHELTSVRFAELVRGGKWSEAVRLLGMAVDERVKLILHGALFQSLFAVFSFWVVSSSGNSLGKGLVLGMMLNFLLWDFELLKSGQSGKIFWQIKREITSHEARVWVLVLACVFGYATLISWY